MNNLLHFFDELELEELKEKDAYTKAQKIVKRLFKEKLDKGGNPYLNHLYYVSDRLEEVNMKTVGLLHDLLEDTIITESDLKKIGFSEDIIETLLLITRKEDELYDEYIDRILESNNMIAINVKALDMENNMDLSRIKNPTPKDLSRCENKYKPQYERIINYLREKENEI